VASLEIVRDDRRITIPVKLAERPQADPAAESGADAGERPQPSAWKGAALGLSIRDMDRDFSVRATLPADVRGVVVSQVEPMSPAFDARIERGDVLMEINRQPVRSAADYRARLARARAGDVLTFYLYNPKTTQRTLQTVRIE
jgi:serine protease Do